jgi:superfamily II DNA/RNA helicase
MTFQALGLPEKMCLALQQAGLTTPTAVQTGAIPAALAGKDVISTARTGSGKTLAYALPTLVRLSQNANANALILVPTRELGVQVQTVMAPFMRSMGLGAPCLIIGGVSMRPQVQDLRNRPRVIIATPGRLIDHIQNGRQRLDAVKVLILDEADRMLDMGFLPQVKNVVRVLSTDRQTMLFTATMPSDLRQVLRDLLKNPEQILVDAPSTVNTDIEQKMIEVSSTGKNDALLDAVNEKLETVLVFTRTKRRSDKVAQFLLSMGVKADRIHGDRSQSQRQKALDSFRQGKIKVLVATDIAARGLDIPLVELVVNFDLPEQKEDYVHRIGRTGRAGAKGEALSFVAPEDRAQWADIMGVKRPAGAQRVVRNPQQNRQGGGGGQRGGRPQGRTQRFGGGGSGGGQQRGGRPQGRSAQPRRDDQAPARAQGSFSGGTYNREEPRAETRSAPRPSWGARQPAKVW